MYLVYENKIHSFTIILCVILRFMDYDYNFAIKYIHDYTYQRKYLIILRFIKPISSHSTIDVVTVVMSIYFKQ
jgi:hypothetical protein